MYCVNENEDAKAQVGKVYSVNENLDAHPHLPSSFNFSFFPSVTLV